MKGAHHNVFATTSYLPCKIEVTVPRLGGIEFIAWSVDGSGQVNCRAPFVGRYVPYVEVLSGAGVGERAVGGEIQPGTIGGESGLQISVLPAERCDLRLGPGPVIAVDVHDGVQHEAVLLEGIENIVAIGGNGHIAVAPGVGDGEQDGCIA